MQNETSPLMEGRSFPGRFGFFLASFMAETSTHSEARNKEFRKEKPLKSCRDENGYQIQLSESLFDMFLEVP